MVDCPLGSLILAAGVIAVTDNHDKDSRIDRVFAAQQQTALELRGSTAKERIEQLNGNLRILSSETGSRIEATVPLSHMLPPETGDARSRKASA